MKRRTAIASLIALLGISTLHARAEDAKTFDTGMIPPGHIFLPEGEPKANIFLISGGDGSLTGGYEDDVAITRRLFQSFGLAPERLVADPVSRNTFENAVNSAALIRSRGLGPCLMITSAFHMPRAMGMMRKVGLDVIPWPVDYRTDGITGLSLDVTEPLKQAERTATAWREWLGLIGNYAAGRTTQLFPGP